MQRRLTVEEHRVAIQQVAIHDVALVQLDGLRVDVLEADVASVHADNRLRTRIRIRTGLNHRIQTVNVVRRHPLRESQIHGYFHRNTQLLDGDVGVRRNNRAGGELHALALQIVADASLLRAQSLGQRL